MVEALQMFLFLFKSKYRRKYSWFSPFLCSVIIVLLLFCLQVLAKCTEENCLNGVCRNDSCFCAEGWQGPECQYCGGKIRLKDKQGFIADGPGNYSVGVKCTWLIGDDENTPIRLHVEHFATECGWDHLYIYDGDSVEAPLLAVFSGLIYMDKYTLGSVPDVVAHSGRALIHFFSDDAFNMAGFNISYALGACPSEEHHLNCSGHGTCENSTCTCNDGWAGEACNRPTCPGNCSYPQGRGKCNLRTQSCECSPGYTGSDCSQSTDGAVWDWVRRENAPGFNPPGSGSHSAVLWRRHMYAIGGESYKRGKLVYKFDLDGGVWEELVVKNVSVEPAPRYAASAVQLGDTLYLYGGVVAADNRTPSYVSGELWTLDLIAMTWRNVTPRVPDCQPTQQMCGPLRVAGHTSTLVSVRGEDVMISLFGHSPQYGFLNTVQEYRMQWNEWRVVATRGYPARGGYAHSAAWDTLTQRLYVHAGLVSMSESNQKQRTTLWKTRVLSSGMYSYDPERRVWTLLSPAPMGRFLHSAAFISPGVMLVFGGNTNNDTTTLGARCYSASAMVYDVLCDSWNPLVLPKDMLDGVARYGHSALVDGGAMLVYGGFSGRMRADILRVRTATSCAGRKRVACLHAPLNALLKCAWDVSADACINIATLGMEEAWQGARDPEAERPVCAEPIRARATQRMLEHKERCGAQAECGSCMSTSAWCVWCGACTHQPAAHHTHRCNQNKAVLSLEECGPMEAGSACARLHSCASCLALAAPLTPQRAPHTPPQQNTLGEGAPDNVWLSRSALCHWDYEAGKCRLGNNTEEIAIRSGSAAPSCAPACATLTSCGNCTQEECIWCASESRCVDKNAYTASFPYGQCREWTTQPLRCRHAPMLELAGDGGSDGEGEGSAWDVAGCAWFASCASCRSEPACGWCDDGAGSGLGACRAGGARGARYEQHACPVHAWHFTHCPSCQCNGHSVCAENSSRCIQPCGGSAAGERCETCAPGSWGTALNGGRCKACECDEMATQCHPENGRCFCTTKGMIGDRCDKCDATNHYHPDPVHPGTCYYDLAIDYQFTFNLSKKEDRHYTRINFRNSPAKPDVDADFTVACSEYARMNVTVRHSADNLEIPLHTAVNCSGSFRYRFLKSDHSFGVEDNVTLSTFYVYVYDFQPPLWIQISFSQYPKLNLQQFFITFSSCFLLLLLVAAILWKIKQKYDLYRRRQRLFVEMEQMASRPFSQVLVDVESSDRLHKETSLVGDEDVVRNDEAVLGGGKGVGVSKASPPSPIALEPCAGGRAAVLSLLVRLPTGGLGRTPRGAAGGLAVASALVTLGHPPKLHDARPPSHPAHALTTKRGKHRHPDTLL